MATERVQIQAPFTLGAQIEARAEHPTTSARVLLLQGERAWTYRRYRDECVRMAHFLLGRLGPCDETRPGHVAILLENHFELLSLLGGCAYAGLTLFGVNSGLRGDVLAGVLNHSRARLLVVDEKLAPEVERVRGELRHLTPGNVLRLRTGEAEPPAELDLAARVEAEVGRPDPGRAPPPVEVEPDRNLMVIYTSGTTGLPKGINNNHLKLCITGAAVASNLELSIEDVGYACMPLFHSNSLFVGFMPAFWAGGSLAIRERFSASNFVSDVFRHGVTFWNYVGEPVHYVLGAIERACGGDPDRIAAEVTRSPSNKLRYAIGNGAAPPDIDRFSAWLGLEDMLELYGSTEAAISTFRRKGDPRGTVGEITDPSVKILAEDGSECPLAELDDEGKILNYDKAVGEICRVAADTALFQGYFDNDDANARKYHDGAYHSGDLGHVVLHQGKRYLYFDGRTDDWIRKDGENFSASQIGRIISEHPDVPLAVAYGVPCAISDELVMSALKLREGADFDGRGFFAWCEAQVEGGSMDRKWFPDFVRLVEDFEYTQTAKVLVRSLKQVHFDLERVSDPVYFRRRGDTAFRPLTSRDYAELREEFARAERLELLDR